MIDPLRFDPQFVPKIWGGRRLETVLDKNIPSGNIGESWEISGHPAHLTPCRSNAYAGRNLYEIAATHGPEVYGQHARACASEFPLLLKFIDASDVLSVQVHPDDAYARRHENSFGKSEAWIILDCDPGSFVYRGFRDGVSREDFDGLLSEGRLDEILKKVPVEPGDCIDLPARTVHAIGSGILLCEIQQSSDVTYRVYDWNRMGADGAPRDLHVERARDVMDFSSSAVDTVVPERCRVAGGVREVLVMSDPFILERLNVETTMPIVRQEDCFHLLCVLHGTGAIEWDGGRDELSAGDSLLLPATLGDVSFAAQDTFQAALITVPTVSSSRSRSHEG